MWPAVWIIFLFYVQALPTTGFRIWHQILFGYMRGSRKFCQRWYNSDNFFFNRTKIVLTKIAIKAGHHRPLKWLFAGEPMMVQLRMLALVAL